MQYLKYLLRFCAILLKNYNISTESNQNVFHFSSPDNLKCHEECLGDCSDPLATGCQMCRHFRIMYLNEKKVECVRECPRNLFALSSICVDADYCKRVNKTAIFGECRDSCPLIIIEKSDPTYAVNPAICAKECPGIEGTYQL